VGGLAYVADDVAGVRVIDVSDPTAPFELGGVTKGGVALGVAVVDGLTYVANDTSGLRIIEFGPEYVAIPEPNALSVLVSGALTLALLRRASRRRYTNSSEGSEGDGRHDGIRQCERIL